MSYSYDKALAAAEELSKMLGVHESDSRAFITRRDGTQPGWRVVVQRMSDGESQTRFIGD